MKRSSRSLARALNEETIQPRDLEIMGMLLPLGIERGKAFKPDDATVALMKAAAAEAQDKATTDVTPWWPDSQWVVPTPPITMPTAFKWETPNYFGVDSRGIALSQYFCPTAKLGTGSFYFGTFHNHSGNPLEGGSNYRLHVPVEVPVREFWSYRYTNEEDGKRLRRYWTTACTACPLKPKCTTGPERRIPRWEHEHLLEAVQQRLDENPMRQRVKRSSIPSARSRPEWAATHFLMKRLPMVAAEMALHVLAYNLTRVMNIIGIKSLIAAIRA